MLQEAKAHLHISMRTYNSQTARQQFAARVRQVTGLVLPLSLRDKLAGSIPNTYIACI